VSILFKAGLVDELSLLVLPVIVCSQTKLFRTFQGETKLRLIKKENVSNYLHLVYHVDKTEEVEEKFFKT
jgi:riboflavin biosynthesis pyrimidine reductase